MSPDPGPTHALTLEALTSLFTYDSQVVERVVPFLTSNIDLPAAKKKCTAMETEELRRAAAWKPAEMELSWDWSTKTFDVFLSHKITDAKDIVLGWYNTLSAMTYTPKESSPSPTP